MKFYQEVVGLTISRRLAAGPGMDIVFLGEGETKIELIFDAKHLETNEPGGIFLGFEVDSVDEKIKFLKEKGLEISGPYQPQPYIKFFYVKDPNGVNIQFVENI